MILNIENPFSLGPDDVPSFIFKQCGKLIASTLNLFTSNSLSTRRFSGKPKANVYKILL